MNGRKFELLGWRIHKSIVKIRLSKVNKNWVCFRSSTKKNNLGYRLLVQVSRILLTCVLFQHSSQQTLCALFWLVLSLIVQFFSKTLFRYGLRRRHAKSLQQTRGRCFRYNGNTFNCHHGLQQTQTRLSSRLESRETQGSQSRSQTRTMHFCSLSLSLV